MYFLIILAETEYICAIFLIIVKCCQIVKRLFSTIWQCHMAYCGLYFCMGWAWILQDILLIFSCIGTYSSLCLAMVTKTLILLFLCCLFWAIFSQPHLSIAFSTLMICLTVYSVYLETVNIASRYIITVTSLSLSFLMYLKGYILYFLTPMRLSLSYCISFQCCIYVYTPLLVLQLTWSCTGFSLDQQRNFSNLHWLQLYIPAFCIFETYLP